MAKSILLQRLLSTPLDSNSFVPAFPPFPYDLQSSPTCLPSSQTSLCLMIHFIQRIALAAPDRSYLVSSGKIKFCLRYYTCIACFIDAIYIDKLSIKSIGIVGLHRCNVRGDVMQRPQAVTGTSVCKLTEEVL